MRDPMAGGDGGWHGVVADRVVALQIARRLSRHSLGQAGGARVLTESNRLPTGASDRSHKVLARRLEPRNDALI